MSAEELLAAGFFGGPKESEKAVAMSCVAEVSALSLDLVLGACSKRKCS